MKDSADSRSDKKGRLTKLGALADGARQRHDLFIGLVAPIGSSKSKVIAGLETGLKPYGYAVEPIRLADLLNDVLEPGEEQLPDRKDPEYYKTRMDAGDELRRKAGDDSALAAMAVARVAAKREQSRGAKPRDAQLLPTAFVFDSLKHPREAELLQNVYGSAFWLVSLVEDVSDRLRNLTEELAKQEHTFDPVPEARALQLLARDEADPDAPNGQHVRDVFAAGDFFLPLRRGVAWHEELNRLLRGVFDAPFMSPSPDEDAMRHAQAAALRSAAIGRQVGAVIVPNLGTPYVLGTNEVPKPGGGQYREGDVPDHRDFQAGADPNPAYTERVLRELLSRLAKAKYFTEERNTAGGAEVLKEATAKDPDGKSILDGTRAKSLIEFTRCLHAEQAAIVDAARSGIAIGGARLYTTTFPCHECTKFIIGAGIVEVQYIEPYPKSLAGDLYSDLIDTLPPLSDPSGGNAGQLERVPFRPFVGFGPFRYDDVFKAGVRRAGAGVVEHVPAVAVPVGAGWSEVAVTTKEGEVVLAINEVVAGLRQASASKSKSAESADDITRSRDVPAEGGSESVSEHA